MGNGAVKKRGEWRNIIGIRAHRHHDRSTEKAMYNRRPFFLTAAVTTAMLSLVVPFLHWQGAQGVILPVSLLVIALVAFTSLLQPYCWRVLEWRLDRGLVEWRRWLALRAHSSALADRQCIEGAFQMASYEGITTEFQQQLAARRGAPVTVGELWEMLEASRQEREGRKSHVL